MAKKYLQLIVLVIAIITIISGLVQVFVPGFVLSNIGAEVTATSKHFFGIIGMFMALFGGLMVHTIYSAQPSQAAIFWCAMQKLGAFVAVSLGIWNDIFSMIGGAVAGFDLLSGILFLIYLKRIEK